MLIKLVTENSEKKEFLPDYEKIVHQTMLWFAKKGELQMMMSTRSHEIKSAMTEKNEIFL